jgi:periplasmic protein CpxP/Spy
MVDNVRTRNDSMKTIRSSHLAAAAVVALLALPAAALAQPAQSPAPAAPPADASSPMTSQPVPGKNTAERVQNHIKQLHAQLHITPAEQTQWDQFANVMRENARDMDQAFMQRAQQYSTMNAVQNMQSYQQIAEAHAQHLQKLVPAFDNLYNAMPEQQKKLTSIPRQRGAACSAIPSWRDRDSKMKAVCASAPAPNSRLSSALRPCRGDMLRLTITSSQIFRESPRGRNPSRLSCHLASCLRLSLRGFWSRATWDIRRT